MGGNACCLELQLIELRRFVIAAPEYCMAVLDRPSRRPVIEDSSTMESGVPICIPRELPAGRRQSNLDISRQAGAGRQH